MGYRFLIVFNTLALAAGCQRENTESPATKTVSKTAAEQKTVKPVSPQVEPLLLATFNAYYRNTNYGEIVQTLLQSQASIVALQETTPRLAFELRQRLNRVYPYQYFTGDQYGYYGERFGILSKVPLKNVRFIPPRHGLFGFLTAEFHWGRQSVKLINVHLQPFEAGLNRYFFQQLAGIEDCHRQEIAEVLKQTSPAQPTIILGDFNSPSRLVAPTELRKLNYVDSFATSFGSVEEADKQTTFRWPADNPKLKLRIDYIFHTPHFITRSSRVGDNCGSDHHLMLSELVLVEPGGR